MPPKNPYRVPKTMQATYDQITTLTDAVCQEHLNEEYADLARKLCATLSRKRPSPLSRGRAKSWAGAILYTLARVNFLFDPSQEPHMMASELCTAAGISQGTASAKATQIMDLLDIYQMDPNWTTSSLMEDNPLAWLIMVDGLIVDARNLPPEIQEIAYQKGLIPYIPGEQ
jgi:hypothetical protein